MKHLLIFDLSNLCYIGAKSKPATEPGSEEAYFENTLNYLRDQYRYFQPDQAIFACDHEDTYWRTQFFPEYKANRIDNEFKQTIRRVIKRFKTEKKEMCLETPHCEADDVIYALCQFTDYRITILSSDADFEQLLNDRIRVFSPTRNEFRLRSRDVAFDLFVKCIRGDRTDNIPSALPMVTRKRLLQAFRDQNPVAFLEKLYRQYPNFGADFARNKTLIDLSAMPDKYKQVLKTDAEKFFHERV